MPEIFDKIVAELAAAEVSSPRLETRMILAHILGCEPGEISSAVRLSEEQQKQVAVLVQKRVRHWPLDKILGHKEFYKWDFLTNENVLSPRPETEILLEAAVKYAKEKKTAALSFLDLGSGSGCLLVSLLKEFPNARGTAVDISTAALEVAQKNARRLEVTKRAEFVNADWFSADFKEKVSKQYDVVVTNPPYIPSAEIASLAEEVKAYDPYAALDGGKSGFDSYRQIAALASGLLTDEGCIFIEAGINQARQIADIFCGKGLRLVEIIPDLSGIERCVILQKQVA